MTRIAEVHVVCTNCGGDTGPGLWVTVGALIVAALALLIAFREHRVFMRELAARAKFRLIPSVMEASEPGYTIRTDAGSNIAVRVVFGLKNDGHKAASTTILNALVGQEHVVSLRWCGPNGEELERIPSAGHTIEDFEGNGTKISAHWLPLELSRVAKRPFYVRYFEFLVAIPAENEITIPVRLKAEADELPDEVGEAIETLQVRVIRESRSTT